LKIHLVRHAETIWHNEDRYAGHTDIELTKNGFEQANNLRQWSIKQDIDAIYTSALQRSILTAQPTATALNIEPRVDINLNEVNFGSIEGLTKSEFRSKFPEIWQEFQIRPANTKFPGGETGVEALNRFVKSISNIIKLDSYSELLVLSHGTLIRLFLTYLLSKDLNQYRKLFPVIENVSITTISLDDLTSNFQLDLNFKMYQYNSKLT
jgi:probable phosphoglycerate mutase